MDWDRDSKFQRIQSLGSIHLFHILVYHNNDYGWLWRLACCQHKGDDLHHILEFRNSVQAAPTFVTCNHLPPRLKEQILTYMCLRFRAETLNQQQLIEQLPKLICQSICERLFLPIIDKVYLSRGVSREILLLLCSIFIRMESEDRVSQLPKLMGGKLYWSTAMDDCMLEIFLNHLAQGRRTPSGWKKSTTYHAIKETLKLNLNMDVSINQIENRVKTMRNQIMAFKTLNSSCSGFGWDSETMVLTADELVWDEALKANPNLKTYKKKLLPRFNEWMDVIGDNSANGNIQKTCFTADIDSHVEDPVDLTTQHNIDPLLGSSMTFETINLDEDGGTQHVSSSPTLPQLPKTSKFPQRKCKSLAMGLKEEMGNMSETMETFVDVLKEKNRYDDIIWDQVSAAIYSIEEMDEDTKVEALELFSGENVENRKRCFLGLSFHGVTFTCSFGALLIFTFYLC